MPKNNLKQLKDFFSTPEKPVSSAEFMAFRKSLSEEEKHYYDEVADLDG